MTFLGQRRSVLIKNLFVSVFIYEHLSPLLSLIYDILLGEKEVKSKFMEDTHTNKTTKPHTHTLDTFYQFQSYS